jgi:hypothetical protein
MGLTAAEIAEGVYEESEGEGMITLEPIFGDEANLSSGMFRKGDVRESILQ